MSHAVSAYIIIIVVVVIVVVVIVVVSASQGKALSLNPSFRLTQKKVPESGASSRLFDTESQGLTHIPVLPLGGHTAVVSRPRAPVIVLNDLATSFSEEVRLVNSMM